MSLKQIALEAYFTLVLLYSDGRYLRCGMKLLKRRKPPYGISHTTASFVEHPLTEKHQLY
jgi:hypothetical protein